MYEDVPRLPCGPDNWAGGSRSGGGTGGSVEVGVCTWMCSVQREPSNSSDVPVRSRVEIWASQPGSKCEEGRPGMEGEGTENSYVSEVLYRDMGPGGQPENCDGHVCHLSQTQPSTKTCSLGRTPASLGSTTRRTEADKGIKASETRVHAVSSTQKGTCCRGFGFLKFMQEEKTVVQPSLRVTEPLHSLRLYSSLGAFFFLGNPQQGHQSQPRTRLKSKTPCSTQAYPINLRYQP